MDLVMDERTERLVEDVHVLLARYVRQSNDRGVALDEVTRVMFHLARSYGCGEDREVLLREVSEVPGVARLGA